MKVSTISQRRSHWCCLSRKYKNRSVHQWIANDKINLHIFTGS